ncbi:transglycosylase domain-containing protein [Candidatus Saccharibacteria bacterium]|nr:transglycosylase domain-containing protein [Candidatus Saccharibacteria bacterium]
MARKLPKRRPRKVANRGVGAHPEAAKLASPQAVKGWSRLRPGNIWKAISSKKGRRIIGGAFAGVILLLVLVFLWVAKDLPSPNKINSQINAQTTKLYDRTGQTVLIEVYGDKNRTVVDLKTIPENCRNATVALEDKNFYKQGAFSPAGIGRALTGIIFRDPSRGGGSTITQQYVKNAFLTGERTYTRKLKELILAMQIELLYQKDDILKLYLNEIPYGSTAYGIQAGAKTYFDKDVKDLNLAECASLAALPQAPSYYNKNREALYARKDLTLDLMTEQGYITKDQAEAAKKEDIASKMKVRNYAANVIAPHFVQYVRDQLEEKYGVKSVNEGGLKVITSLDIEKQRTAEAAVKNNITNVRKYGGSNAALVSEDTATSEILAMVGSYDYNDEVVGNFNVAAANRQPGSSFKPIVYASMFKKNWGAGSTMYDVQTDFGGGYKPKNYTGRFYGIQSVRKSLASSLNIPAVKALYIAGIPETIQTANDLGISTFSKNDTSRLGLAMALGSGEVKLTEMVNAFSAFPNEGQIRNQVAVLSVTDPNGKILEKNNPDTNKSKQVLEPQIAYMINSILSDNNARCSLGVFTCSNPLTLKGKTVAAKTGTTEDYRDAWTMGYTKKTVTGVWAGNNDNKPMTQAASIVSAPIWQEYMSKVTASESNDGFSKPAGIKEVEIDADTGRLPNESTKNKRTDIFPSWYKPTPALTSSSGKINKLDGKLATECTPTDALQDVNANSITAEIASTDISYARWQPPVAALAAKLGFTAGASLPTEKSTMHDCSDTKPTVSISVSPSSGSKFTITATVVSGKNPAQKLLYFINDQQFTTQQINGNGTYPLEYVPGLLGPIKFQVKVQDSVLYSGTSNTVTVTGSEEDFSVSCSGGSGICTISGSGISSAQYYINSPPYKAAAGLSFGGYKNGDNVVVRINKTGGGQTTITYP